MRKNASKYWSKCKGCRRKGNFRNEYCGECRILIRKFGAHPADITKLFIIQDNKCRICGRPPEKRALAIDHSHETDKVRGLLCNRCNTGLGCFPTTELLQSAINYLASPPEWIRQLARKTCISRAAVMDRFHERYLESLTDIAIESERARAKLLAKEFKISEEAAMSRIRRFKIPKVLEEPQDIVDFS